MCPRSRNLAHQVHLPRKYVDHLITCKTWIPQVKSNRWTHVDTFLVNRGGLVISVVRSKAGRGRLRPSRCHPGLWCCGWSTLLDHPGSPEDGQSDAPGTYRCVYICRAEIHLQPGSLETLNDIFQSMPFFTCVLLSIVCRAFVYIH